MLDTGSEDERLKKFQTVLPPIGAGALFWLLTFPLSAQIAPVPTNVAVGAKPEAREPVCRVQAPVANWDAAAQLVAGVSSTSYADAFTPEQKSAWGDYAKTAAADWRRLKLRYVDRISAWRGRNLTMPAGPQTVFYPFSGPDATNAMAFFPDARDYVLVGLEPVGCIPSRAEEFTPEYWPGLRLGWQSAVSMGFFKTEDMERDLAGGEPGGVLPVLLFLIARAGNSIIDVSPIGITPRGALITPSDAVKTETRGVAIQFRSTGPQAGSTQVRTLRYFASNLINTRMRKKPGTTKYFQNLPAGATLVKSASYLMHKRYFSDIRELILARSAVIVEDDSGIPFHYFDPVQWDVHLFGTYDEPIKMFGKWTQDDLKTAYEAKQNVQPLDFGISYKFRNGESNLLLAIRKRK